MLADINNEINKIENWGNILRKITLEPYWAELEKRVAGSYKSGVNHPSPENIFRALKLCPLSSVRVVIIGQDPYHGPDQADGLAFSVPLGNKTPPSLRNILIERNNDLNISPRGTDLSDLANQGVLLLNTVLTVSSGKAGSHRKWGWEQVTLEIIKAVNSLPFGVCFLLWGNDAQRFKSVIDSPLHQIFTAPHPSPLSAYRGFLGAKPFSKVNSALLDMGHSEINW